MSQGSWEEWLKVKGGVTTAWKAGMFRERVLILLGWLVEFRCCSHNIVQDLLGTSGQQTYKFLQQCVRDGLVDKFSNVHTRGINLYCIGATGYDRLRANAVDFKAGIRVERLARNTRIIHDLCVQKIGLSLIREFDCVELLWDLNNPVENGTRPDLLCTGRSGDCAAVEFDRTPKGEAEFYERAWVYHDWIKEGRLQAAFMMVDSERVFEKYRRYCEAKAWPVYRRNKEGKLVDLKEVVEPSQEARVLIQLRNVSSIVEDVVTGNLPRNWTADSEI